MIYTQVYQMAKLQHYPIPETSLPSITEYEPVLAPTGQTNTRPVGCGQCKARLAKGAGYQWGWSPVAQHYVRHLSPVYYCRPCHNHRLEMAEIAPYVSQSMKQIEAWLDAYMGPSARSFLLDYAEKKVSGCGTLGAEVAEAIVERLPLVRKATYPNVTGLVDEIVSQLCEPVGGER